MKRRVTDGWLTIFYLERRRGKKKRSKLSSQKVPYKKTLTRQHREIFESPTSPFGGPIMAPGRPAERLRTVMEFLKAGSFFGGVAVEGEK